jgi:hypothetical protein
MATPPAKKRVVQGQESRRSRASSRRVKAADGDIARRAYELFIARGREHGHDIDDWLQAELELSKRRSVARRGAHHAGDA